MQNWKKIGLIYDGIGIEGYTYAAVPFGLFISKDVLRIFFSKRNSNNCSLPFYLDYNLKDNKIEYLEPLPILPLGMVGCFDDSGVMPSSLVQIENKIYLYYIGWNLGITVPFRNAIGMAQSTDLGKTFLKCFEGPIIDRTKTQPYFVASNCVLFDDGVWKIWYLSCVKWLNINEKKEHYYHIKYATSKDGINWDRDGMVAIDFIYPNEYAISVPRVLKEGGLYKMWYSYRGGEKSNFYRIGYGESFDGIIWERKDEMVNLEPTLNSWDSNMICYPFIFDYNENRYMLYNGNDYGKTGFGLAILKN